MNPQAPSDRLGAGARAELAPGRWYALSRVPGDGASARARVLGADGTESVFDVDLPREVLIAPAARARILESLGPGALRLRPRAAALAWAQSAMRKLATPGLARSLASAIRLLARGRWRELAARLARGPAPELAIAPDIPADLPPRAARLGAVRPRLVIVGPALAPGGAQACQFELAQGLAARGAFDIRVLAPAGGALEGAYRAAGIALEIDAPVPSGALDLDDYATGVAALARRLDRADLVLANTLGAFPAIEAARRARTACVLNPRESERDFFADRSRDVHARALGAFAMADRVVFVAKATAEVWRGFDRGHFAVVPDALGPLATQPGKLDRAIARASLGIPPDAFLALCVGTLAPRKGQLDLARAIGRLAPATRAMAALVGARGDDYAARCVLEDPARVRVVAETLAVGPWYAAADVFVLCSRHESYPRVVLEAMAHALPIVATPVYGVREQIRDGIDGWFYPPGDDETLASHLAALAADSGKRAHLGAAARARLGALPGFETMLDGYARELAAALHIMR
jgi:glycosyltransferase involved in cell wall biosynthesis